MARQASWDSDLKQREVVAAFLSAARNGDFDALLEVLAPDVVLRADRGPIPPAASRVIRGARAIAGNAMTFSKLGGFARTALVNGAAGIVGFRSEAAGSSRGVPLGGTKRRF